MPQPRQINCFAPSPRPEIPKIRRIFAFDSGIDMTTSQASHSKRYFYAPDIIQSNFPA